MQGSRTTRRARRAGAVTGALAAASVAALVTAPPVSAEVRKATRTDSFDFTVTSTGTQVTCTFTSTLEHDSETQRFTASTVITGTERPECRASWPEVTVVEPDGRTFEAQGYGGVVSMSAGPVGDTLESAHFVHFQACNCASPVVSQSLPK